MKSHNRTAKNVLQKPTASQLEGKKNVLRLLAKEKANKNQESQAKPNRSHITKVTKQFSKSHAP